MDVAFGNRTRIGVLRTLAADPLRTWTERQIALASDASPTGVNLAVRALHEAGILEVVRVGRTHAVRLRSGLGVVDAIEDVFRLEARVAADYHKALRDALPRGAICYLFGSTATGGATEESDVDVLLVAASQGAAEAAAARIVQAASAILPARLNVLALDEPGAKRRLRTPLFKAIRAGGVRLSERGLEALE